MSTNQTPTLIPPSYPALEAEAYRALEAADELDARAADSFRPWAEVEVDVWFEDIVAAQPTCTHRSNACASISL